MTARTQIRNAIVAALVADGSFSTRVYPGRRRSIPRASLPACCVYVEQEEKELGGINQPYEFIRTLTIVLEIYSAETNTDTAALDTLCLDVEAALLADETLSGLALSLLPLSDAYQISEEGDHSGTFSESRYAVQYVA